MAKQIIKEVLMSCEYDYVVHTREEAKRDAVARELAEDSTIKKFKSHLWECDISKIRNGKFKLTGFRGTPTKFKVILLDK